MIIDVNAHFGSDSSMPAEYTEQQLTELLMRAGIERVVATELHSDREQSSFSGGVRVYPTYKPAGLDALAQSQSGRMLQVVLRLQDPRVLPQTAPSAKVIEDLKDIAAAHGDTKFIISGAILAEANANKDLFTRDNVWMDISSLQHPTNSLVKLIDAIGSEHILFGSNAPIFYPYSNVFRVMNSKIPDDDRERILWRNALGLGL